MKWPDPSGAWHLAVLDGNTLRVIGLGGGVEKTAVPGVAGSTFAFFRDRTVIAHAENRRQFLRIVDSDGRKRYEEVLEPGGVLFASSDDSFLISECTQDRCPTVWRYRFPELHPPDLAGLIPVPRIQGQPSPVPSPTG